MSTIVKNLPRPCCLLLLLCVGCDHAWSTFAGPDELRGATPTMRDGKDDGDDASEDDPTLPIIICCDCYGRSCSQPATPEPPTSG